MDSFLSQFGSKLVIIEVFHFLVVIFHMIWQVNRIRELPQNTKIVATHTDSPDVSTLHSLISVEKYVVVV